MHIKTYKISFTTPAFLGGATQSAEWRLAPIKAMLRRWWRVEWMASHQFSPSIASLREAEAAVFGHAWLDTDPAKARQSPVRLRLQADPGSAAFPVPAVGALPHETQIGVQPLSTSVDNSHAWYGLHQNSKGKTSREALKPGSSRQLSIATPSRYAQVLTNTISLANEFGCIGSGSGRGWGALHIHACEQFGPECLQRYARPLDACLQHDWPASLATDTNRSLAIWAGRSPYDSWDQAMAFIGVTRKAARQALERHHRRALGFAGGQGRMANPLRWKVVPQGSSYQVHAYAMPHGIPPASGKPMPHSQLMAVWNDVFDCLDNVAGLIRLGATLGGRL